MGEPRLFMLDEPSLGFAPRITGILFEKIREVYRDGTTILIIEQNAKVAFGSDRTVYDLNSDRTRRSLVVEFPFPFLVFFLGFSNGRCEDSCVKNELIQ